MQLRVLVPDPTTNYVKNPSLRYDTTDWNAQGATLTRSLARARFGIASLKVVTSGAALREGAYFRVSALSGISEPVTVSIYARGTGRVRIRLDNNVLGGTEFSSVAVDLTDERWTRIWVTGFSTGGNDLRLYVETDENAAVIRTFYLDGAQLERKAYPTSYCDGDQPGCRWNGLYHNSTASRPVSTRLGGKWIQLAGKEREAEDLYVTVIGGLGAAGVRNNIQEFALAPGAYFQNNKVAVRVITLTFHAKHHVDERDDPVSLAYLHQLRQTLLDLVKPDRTAGDQELLFEYSDGAVPLYFRARYDGGLEGDWDIRNQFVNSFPLRLLAVTPFLEEDSQEVFELDIQNSMLINYAYGRLNGAWGHLNYGFNAAVGGVALGPQGQVYMGGAFSVVNNNAAALDPLRTARVAYWDGEKWVAIATSISASGTINCIAIAPNGDVIVGGDFTSIHGVAANYIAKYSGGTWSAFGSGMNGIVRCLSVAPNGDVIAGGSFSTAGGVSCSRVARWDGFQWRRMGQYGGFDGTVWSLAVTPDGNTIYVGGEFQNEVGLGTNLLKRIALYNVSTGLFSAMGSGFAGGVSTTRVYKLLISRSGTLYAGGDFTLSGTDSVLNIAFYSGGAWAQVGSGVDKDVNDIAEFPDGTLLMVGKFNNAGSVPVSKCALWNGSAFTLFDNTISVSTTDNLSGCVIQPNNDVFLGIGSNVGTQIQVLSSGINTVDNPGSAETAPSLYAKGPGTLKWIENQSGGKRLYLNLALLSNEEVFFDFGAGTILSTVRGNLLTSLLGGSDFHNFTLLPGENLLAVMVVMDVGALMQVRWTPQHWSADATQRDAAYG